MGRHAAVVEWESRTQRDFLLRHQSVACRGAATTAPHSHGPLGRRCRYVPRLVPAWRNSFQQVYGGLVSSSGAGDSARQCDRAQGPLDEGKFVGTGNAVERGVGCKLLRYSCQRACARDGRRLVSSPFTGLVEGYYTIAERRQLGRLWTSPAWKL